ncbi:hypothetical protein DEU56DRAFT_226123 [Suillus clintonianus]|uniref:uncharacterized protein n=1 Tax=Suillus clintonianus TaxID=1904413 RepID=UPI001B87B3AD|nr:uncharacterized protein DEU56DRAFT_226123 [Suillus clintonianus]KAG2156241.1 hypothetical protein DEU56DRAFT_226123 [Suillus clintonianus]
MRSFATILLASITSTLAYQVTAPGDTQGWTTVGPNYLTWVRVDTDPSNFTAVLTNQAVMPQGPQVLNALVDGTLGTIICNPPSGGWPQGSGFRVNLAADAEHLNTLLAQSNQFSINASTSSAGSTSSVTSSTSTPTTAVALTTAAASTTSSDTNTTPTASGAAVLGMKVETGFLTAFAALAAFITTHL